MCRGIVVRACCCSPELSIEADTGNAETAGLEGFVTGSWQGIVAPARTPPEVIAKLNAEVAPILKLPDVVQTLDSQGTTTNPTSPQDMSRWLAAEQERWTIVVRDSGFRLDQ